VDQGGAFDLNEGGYFARIGDYGFVSGSSNHAHRMKTIRWVNEQYGVTIDTHTADGLKVAAEFRELEVPMVVLETALPAKFEEAIQEALGHAPQRPEDLQGLEDLPQRFEVMDADVDAIKRFIVDHT
jgi:threonine synthase